MSRRNRDRTAAKQPRTKRNWFLLPLLIVGGLYVQYGASELLPVSRPYGIFWTAAAALCLLFLSFHTFRKSGSPRRVETLDENGVPESPPPADNAEEQENLALDAEISHEVYLRAKAAADAAAEQEAREKLRQLRALRALESITEEEYEAERRKVWERM